MTKVTVSAKISPELVKRVAHIGYHTSDVIQVGIEMFLNLPDSQQKTLIRDWLVRKKREKVLRLYRPGLWCDCEAE